MAQGNCVADVVKLCTAATKKGHPQFGVVQTPAAWARLAGYSGSAASPLRQHMARRSSNGVGRSGRYAPQSAGDMLELLSLADAFVKAETQKAQDQQRARIRKQLDKHRTPAGKSGARAAKRQAPAKAAAPKPKATA